MDNETATRQNPTYNVMDIANYVVRHFIKLKHPIPNLLLLKILYYLQADSLRRTGQPLFDGVIEKWGYGPVEPEVYSNFKSYGAAPITSTAQYVEIDDDGSWQVINPKDRQLQNQDRELIDALADEIYKKYWYRPFQLVNKTHKEPMWKKDEEDIRNGVMNIPYKNDEIRDYFSKQGKWPWDN